MNAERIPQTQGIEKVKAVVTARKGASKVGKSRPESKAKRQHMTARKRMAVAVGSVGVAVLGLSVVHCTEAIVALTGSHVILAGLLAIGIDAGMVACEMAAILTHRDENRKCERWATAYIVMAVLLSCLLNGWASAHHAESGLKLAAWAVGGLIPILVFVLGKVAGLLWE